jgi:polar amino acid transport system substrate-binding protein
MPCQREGARALLLAAFAASGCAALPRDNYGTFERIHSEHVLRVGATEDPPWVKRSGGAIAGFEAELIRTFAARHRARVDWSWGTQIKLAERIHRKQLDVLIAGLEDDTPLQGKIVLTRPHATTREPDGETVRHVIAVMPGESRLLYELDSFLLNDAGALRIRHAAESAR